MGREGNISSSGVTTGQQFEVALRTAEVLMVQVDCAREKASRLLAVEIGIVAVALAGSAIPVTLGLPSGALRSILVMIIGGVAGIAVAKAIHVTVRAHLLNQSRRDIQAVVDIVGLLREVLPLVADIEDWNETEVRLADARLSRFPIGVEGSSR